jgi:aerobic C4-dicarboxylate transport protein
MRDLSAVGRVAGKAFAYFLFFSTLALIVGLIVANVVRPGAGLNIDPATLDPSRVATYSEQAHETTLTGFLMSIIPDTFLSALTDGNILQTLFVAILFGIGLAMIGERGNRVLVALNDVSLAVFKIVAILMKAAPVGAFGAMAFTIGRYGVGTLANLAALVGTFYLTSLLFVIVVLGAVARLCGFSIFRLIAYLKAELLLVLGTSSSESALPSLIEKMERAGCPKTVVGLVVPTGYSFNLDGTNIYMTLAALFIAQACNVELTLGQQLLLTWKSLEMARLRIEALSQGSVREAEAALRVAQAAYRFGERGILDVLDAQRVLRSVRADLIQARFQLQEARILLEQLIGQNTEHTPS